MPAAETANNEIDMEKEQAIRLDERRVVGATSYEMSQSHEHACFHKLFFSSSHQTAHQAFTSTWSTRPMLVWQALAKDRAGKLSQGLHNEPYSA